MHQNTHSRKALLLGNPVKSIHHNNRNYGVHSSIIAVAWGEIIGTLFWCSYVDHSFAKQSQRATLCSPPVHVHMIQNNANINLC
mmetsp:Transcript_73574/g.130206  ORF Transcript_73574/g.130206 Transcript_73574/m.130206 type:complete len:84 (+) Transcript_73574:59-310(+)